MSTRSNSNTVGNLYSIFTRHPRVTTDSRNIPAGSIFFALRGDKFDGNAYAAEAIAKGAAYAVVDAPAVAADDRYILVGDTLTALQELASEHRKALGLPILAITGSNGKTTTKELITRVLGRKFNVCATKGNLNNHIGVPLTLLSFDKDTEFGIVEMGANHPGEIAALCRIATPDFGLITNIGLAHLEGFGSPEGVARAKGELYDYLTAYGGKAFMRMEDETLARMAADRAALQVVGYSGDAADGLESNLTGDYNRLNISAAVAIGRYFGVGETDIKDAVASYVPDNMRSQHLDTARNTLIIDCYNANPSSMRSAIGNLDNNTASKPIAVILGDMGELGSYSQAEHIKVLQLLEEKSIGEQYLVGKHFDAAAAAVPANGDRKLFPDTKTLGQYLNDNQISGKSILVKGSRATGLERIIEFL